VLAAFFGINWLTGAPSVFQAIASRRIWRERQGWCQVDNETHWLSSLAHQPGTPNLNSARGVMRAGVLGNRPRLFMEDLCKPQRMAASAMRFLFNHVPMGGRVPALGSLTGG